MVRILGNIVGAVFAGVLLIALGSTISGYFSEPPVPTAAEEFHLHPEHLALSSDGPFGKYDKAQLQRGLQVYKEVCSGCHSLSRVAFRDLKELGYNDAQVKNFAAAYEVPDINPDTGEPANRKALPSDYFPSPYANEVAARAANNNALPPDLSLITKAREGGASYVHALLTGYRDPKTYKNAKGEPLPKDAMPASATLHFNPYFANLNLAMPQPLVSDGQVTYAEGNPKPTVNQMASDVSAFLVWTAEPKLENRHRTGLAVLIFLIIATALGYMSYQNVWAEAKRKVAPVGPLDPENQAKRTRATAKAKTKG
jgi:ubiquinol-cytochrome c reductase cytochrome c1 subunit